MGKKEVQGILGVSGFRSKEAQGRVIVQETFQVLLDQPEQAGVPLSTLKVPCGSSSITYPHTPSGLQYVR